jgi:50S ribosomal protein L16 3-hydroxylase
LAARRKPPTTDRRKRRGLLPAPPTLLGGLDIQTFLSRHWQRRPLLIRGAIPDLQPILSPDELAGLACEEEVNSRLVIEKGGKRPWQVIHGPLTAEHFKRLPRTHWTLLVTDVDRIVPAAADLREHFDFIPQWRIDDVMISYAVDGGSVGPHVDSYDVFLLQAAGRRRWQVSDRVYGSDDFVPGLDLRLLADFTASAQWVLEPGDMLYLPPGVAHYGIAEGECMTYSIGFRAPSHRDLVTAFAEFAATRLPADARYADPGLTRPTQPGEIATQARRRIHSILKAVASDSRLVDDWLGHYLTETGPWGAPRPPRRPLGVGEFSERWARRRILWRSDRCRFAHVNAGRRATLYVDGQAFALPITTTFAAALITGHRRFDHASLAAERRRRGFVELLCLLFNHGYLEFR